ncbi:putative phenazine biosynthesis protein [Rosellinia necatrix]|uniref:Putative phenazine biosynthesis protein n=1 Tax=Rosellinia necatrix TaxID=77044 RepID=A0A1W2TUP1_ROSNE|nr:putative phenazine biosynthesis protein [Rosellinia necatrix]
MDLPFTTLDVFTTKQLEGNPLAIVGVPPSLRDRLTQSMKQKIAQEFNLSETVFFHDDTSKSGSEAREVDIFTIERELPFAGHPTIGTAVFVRHHLGGAGKEVRTLITKAGPIGIEEVPASSGSSSGSSPTAAGAAAAAGVRAEIPHNVHLHAKTLRDVLPATAADDAAAAAGLHPNAAIRAAELDAPLFSIVRGMTFALVPLPSLELLAEVRVLRLDFEGLAAELLDDGWREGLAARYYYVDVAAAGGQEAEEGARSLRTRMVELGFEDPATGSAATALASYLTLTQERRDTKFRVTQGVEMGRKSDISVETTVKGGEGDVALDKVYLGGTAVVVMQGTLRVGY